MKFGVNILNFGPETGPAVLRQWAVTAESLGYHFVMLSDHVAVTIDVQERYPTPFYEPFTSLAWLAGITQKVELGTTVAILPYRHPLLTARITANLDQLSGGRFIFGVGAGWAKREFQALGVPFEQRGAISDEYLSVIKDCWVRDVVSGVWTGPPPARRPHPPVWVGGSSERALRRAVRYGDAWHPIHSRLRWLKEDGIPRLQQLADTEGKRAPAFCPRIDLQVTKERLDEATRFPGQGTLDQIRSDIEALALMGAQYVLFDTYLGKTGARRSSEADIAMFTTLAERVLDLGRQTLR
ncbi:MAG: TIGR03619 family F420-dependent LLM class oxidoreductase [Nitrososphaerota archaeon]|jgi:probable F420-dependent oxidoreductase|nr:TIGR03619 family F420-dependent LLM class oxidoreductase [Nitrososphaerota archaeon]